MIALGAFSFRASADESKPPSYYHDVFPIFKRSCTGCHHPGKLKGELDLTTYAGLAKGGKHGPAFKAGDPDKSELLEQVSGNEPSMPKEGDPLASNEVAISPNGCARAPRTIHPTLPTRLSSTNRPNTPSRPSFRRWRFRRMENSLLSPAITKCCCTKGTGRDSWQDWLVNRRALSRWRFPRTAAAGGNLLPRP